MAINEVAKRDVKKIPLDDIIFNNRDGDFRLAVKTHHAFNDTMG